MSEFPKGELNEERKLMSLLTVEENIQCLHNPLANPLNSNILYSSEHDEPDTSSGPAGINLWSPEADKRKPK